MEKLLNRAEKYNVDLHTPSGSDLNGEADEGAVGQALLAVIAWTHANRIDAEAALRKEAMKVSQQISTIEAR